MRIYSGKIQQSWPLLFPFKILVNGTLETDTLFVFRTCAEALRGCSLIRRSLSGFEMAESVSAALLILGTSEAVGEPSPWWCALHHGPSVLLRTELNLLCVSGIFVSAGVGSLTSMCWFMAEKWEVPRTGTQGICECAQLPFECVLAAEWLTVHIFLKLIILGAISTLDTLWDALWGAPLKQRELPCCASCCCSSTRGGSFPFRDALLFPAVAGRGVFQEGDEEARLNGLKSGFIIFFSILWRKAWELFLSNRFQMVLLEHKDF